MAENRLFVGNLADDITATALRQRFEQVARVADVELAIDRSSGRMRGHAFVTMADSDGYRAALNRLNGVMFEDRVLRVCPPDEGQGEERGRRGKKDAQPRARVTSQFRERTCMAIELDCEGTKLSFKMYPTAVDGGGEVWRIDAASPSRTSLSPVQASGKTRRAAFTEIEKAWGSSALDWRAIEDALENVRAI